MAIEFHSRRFEPREELRALKVGAVGLGAGTIAALGRRGDTFRFYEINPAVAEISKTYFHYLEDSRATTEIVLGDARLQLEAELLAGQPHGFDVLAIDAFSSDAIPIHLLTREAVEIYWKHMAKDGLLLFHISNHSLDLAPIVRAHAEYLGCEVVRIIAQLDEEKDTNYNTWLILTRNQQFIDLAAVRAAASPWQPDERAPVEWTDDFAGLWQILKF
jgi:spermidine synthase